MNNWKFALASGTYFVLWGVYSLTLGPGTHGFGIVLYACIVALGLVSIGLGGHTWYRERGASPAAEPDPSRRFVTANTDRTVSPAPGNIGFMTDNEKRMGIWCQMWSEDPALAHEVMTDSCVQWSGQTADLDGVIGPHQQQQFLTRYRAQHVNVFLPRLIVDSGDRFGYLWDLTRPDGTVHTGADVNILHGGKVDQNWTFVGRRRCDRPDPTEVHPADGDRLAQLCQQWVRAGAVGADRLVTPDFELFAGDEAHAVDELRGEVALTTYLSQRNTVQSALHREPVLDTGRGRAIVLRTDRNADGTETSGLDLLTVRAGRIARAWCLTGTREFRY